MRAKPLAVSLIAALATCGPPLPPEPELRYATTTSACGPNGESYTAIIMTPDKFDFPGPYPPYLRVVLPVSRIMLVSARWGIPLNDSVSAEYVGDYWSQTATRGEVNVTWVDGPVGDVEGSVDLDFTLLTVAQRFRAPWETLTGLTCF